MPTYTTTAKRALRWLQGGNLVSDIDAGFQALAEDVDAALPGYVTSLPGSPSDGQEVFYAADATNGVIWHLRYRSASASAYKWEFIGGSALSSEITTIESPGSASAFVDLGTVGPSIVAPLAGDYEVDLSVYINWVGTQTTADVAPKFGAAAVDLNDAVRAASATGAQDNGTRSRTLPKRTISAAATTVKLQYQSGSTSVAFSRRTLALRPVRVA